eukprot:m51a1_g14085 hypothetical protein (565) ;mRNA; f:13784-15972
MTTSLLLFLAALAAAARASLVPEVQGFGFLLGYPWTRQDCAARTTTFGYTVRVKKWSPAPLEYVVVGVSNPAWPVVSGPAPAWDARANLTGLKFEFDPPLQAGEDRLINFTLGKVLSMAGGLAATGVQNGIRVPFFSNDMGPAEFIELPKPPHMTLLAHVFDFPVAQGHKTNYDFEWDCSKKRCADLKFEPEIVKPELGSDRIPVYNDCRPSKPHCVTVGSNESFSQWFRSVPGVNKVFDVNITLDLDSNGTYTKYDRNFFIADGKGYGNEGFGERYMAGSACRCQEYGTPDCNCRHNYGFCMKINTEFAYKGGEVLFFQGDDDVWMFINNRMVLDLGGAHPPMKHTIDVDASAAALGIAVGNTYPFDMFYCERHTYNSDFMTTTSIDLYNCEGGRVCGWCRATCEKRGYARDSDGDGVPDCQDLCPHDPHKPAPLYCGCGVPEGTCGLSYANVTGTPSSSSSGTLDEPESSSSSVASAGDSSSAVPSASEPAEASSSVERSSGRSGAHAVSSSSSGAALGSSESSEGPAHSSHRPVGSTEASGAGCAGWAPLALAAAAASRLL